MSKHEALVEQPTAKPTTKVTAAGLGAAIATVVLALNEAADTVQLPGWANAALAGVAAFVAGYLKKARLQEPETL